MKLATRPRRPLPVAPQLFPNHRCGVSSNHETRTTSLRRCLLAAALQLMHRPLDSTPMLPRPLLPVLLLLSAVACDNPPVAVVCTTEAIPGLVVEIRSSVDSVPLADNATVSWIEDGPYVETLAGPGSTAAFRSGAVERPGLYTVHVNRPGYQPWVRIDVSVAAGRCHVETVTLQAWLLPAP